MSDKKTTNEKPVKVDMSIKELTELATTNDSMPLFNQYYYKFEGIWNKDENNVEFIYARDLQKLLGYTTWQKFQKPIEKAKDSCSTNNKMVDKHFNHVVKMVSIGSGAKREQDDIKLTRYASYLIAMNGDPRKSEIAFAQNYFAAQTRKLEVVLERMEQVERVESRQKLKESEKEFNRVIYERGVSNKGFGEIKSAGDSAFFGGKNTQQEYKIDNKKTLSDYTDKAINLGKALANTITTMKTKSDDLYGTQPIATQHIKSNTDVRESLTKSNIYPEDLALQEDIKKVERKLKKDEKLLTKVYKISNF